MHFRDTEQIKANSASDSIIYAIRKTIDKDMYTGQSHILQNWPAGNDREGTRV